MDFQGGNQSEWNCQWVDILFTKGFVEQARFRYNYNQGGFNFWLFNWVHRWSYRNAHKRYFADHILLWF